MTQSQQMHKDKTAGRPEGYWISDDKPRPELFDAEAQAEAGKWSKIKTAQVRRFFGQVMADKRHFDLRKGTEDPSADSDACVAMAMLKATSAYAAARDSKRQPLADFVAHHANLVKSLQDFSLFARHFEAVVAWHKVFESQKPRRS